MVGLYGMLGEGRLCGMPGALLPVLSFPSFRVTFGL